METGSNLHMMLVRCTTISGTRFVPSLRRAADGSTACVSSLPSAILTMVVQAKAYLKEAVITLCWFGHASPARLGICMCALPCAWDQMFSQVIQCGIQTRER